MTHWMVSAFTLSCISLSLACGPVSPNARPDAASPDGPVPGADAGDGALHDGSAAPLDAAEDCGGPELLPNTDGGCPPTFDPAQLGGKSCSQAGLQCSYRTYQLVQGACELTAAESWTCFWDCHDRSCDSGAGGGHWVSGG